MPRLHPSAFILHPCLFILPCSSFILVPVTPLLSLLLARIRERGPLTVAEYVDAALYHPDFGYYTSATQRSGRGGDFYTSVDVGPIFGELLAEQFDEMRRLIGTDEDAFDLVEVAAGNGRLTRDVHGRCGCRHSRLRDRRPPPPRRAQRAGACGATCGFLVRMPTH